MSNFWRGEKVQLCAVEEANIDAVLMALEMADTDLDRYEGAISFPLSKEKRRAFFQKMAEHGGKDDVSLYLSGLLKIWRANISVVSAPWVATGVLALFKYGLRLLRPYWRRSYAREAIGTVLRYYFYELRYQKATVSVYSFNERSQRLHESLGFRLEGRLQRTAYTSSTLHDKLCYGLTKKAFGELEPVF